MDVAAFGDGLRDGAQIVDHRVLGHANPTDGGVGLVRDDLDVEIGLTLNLTWVSARLVPDLVQGLAGIGDEPSETDFLVGVEGLNDETHQQLNLPREDAVARCTQVIGRGSWHPARISSAVHHGHPRWETVGQADSDRWERMIWAGGDLSQA